MATVYSTIVAPRLDPFGKEVADFWDVEGARVSAFTTGINQRDGTECIIGNCDYNLVPCLDHCHIIGKLAADTVRSLFAPLSSSLADII